LLAALALVTGLAVGVVSTARPGAGGAKAPTTVAAYWLAASDGGIFSFGGAGFYGSTGNLHLNKPIVGMSGTADSAGYWLVASDGGIFAFGDAGFYGSTGNLVLNKPVVGMAPTPDGKGYWLVASDGGIFAFGDAGFYGSTGNLVLNQPVVGMAATGDGKGYWLVASDGGIFAFGDAGFYGSTGNLNLNKPIVAMTASADGKGYRLVASDGGLFSFGDAPFYGSLGGFPLRYPIVAMAATPDGKGYWMSDANGAVSQFGNATYWGSTPQVLNQPIVAMAEATGTGGFAGSSYPSGSYGYDISNWQCGNLPQGSHTISAVEVVGGSFDGLNPCFAQEVAWAGAGLNLYIYLTYGQQTTGPAICTSTFSPDPAAVQACNYGFAAAIDAYQKASNAGADVNVQWWVDVEPDPSWTGDLVANGATAQGALWALKSEGLNAPGIYASPARWNGIVGSFQPAAPYWMADWWGSDPSWGPYDCTTEWTKYQAKEQLPTGGLVMVQYWDAENDPLGNGPYDADYAC
jgi:hypothetical protein